MGCGSSVKQASEGVPAPVPVPAPKGEGNENEQGERECDGEGESDTRKEAHTLCFYLDFSQDLTPVVDQSTGHGVTGHIRENDLSIDTVDGKPCLRISGGIGLSLDPKLFAFQEGDFTIAMDVKRLSGSNTVFCNAGNDHGVQMYNDYLACRQHGDFYRQFPMPDSNRWHRYACVREGAILSMFVDGNLVMSFDCVQITGKDYFSMHPASCHLGSGGWGGPWTGWLTNVAVYNCADDNEKRGICKKPMQTPAEMPDSSSQCQAQVEENQANQEALQFGATTSMVMEPMPSEELRVPSDMHIAVKSLSGATLQVGVCAQQTVRVAKARIQQQDSFLANKTFALVVEGQRLEDSAILSDAGVEKGTLLFIVLCGPADVEAA